MRAAVFTDLTGPDGVSIVDRPDPEPGAGEVVLDVEAASLNRHDLWVLSGESGFVDESATPFLSGLDLAGTVREVGEAGRYESYYEIDVEDREFYDLHLNTARWSQTGVFEIVRAAIEEYDLQSDEGAFETAPVEIDQ